MQNIDVRVKQEAVFILKNKSTIRDTAKHFGISKSTVHFDLSTRLKKVNFHLHKKVEKLLKNNFQQRHIRGGNATKNKYKLASNIVNISIK